MPNFPGAGSRRRGARDIRARYIYPLFLCTLRSSFLLPSFLSVPSPPLFFFFFFFHFHYACLRDAHRVSPPSIRAEVAAEKYRALTRRLSSTQMGIESRLEMVLEIAAFNSCMSKNEEGWRGMARGQARAARPSSSLTGGRPCRLRQHSAARTETGDISREFHIEAIAACIFRGPFSILFLAFVL